MIIDDLLLNKVTEAAQASERLRMNLNLHQNLNDKVQRLLNALEPGTLLPIHRHRTTEETYLLLRGSIKVFFYGADGTCTEEFLLDPLKGEYGVHIPKGQWHTVEVLETGTVIFEVKEGPYAPIAPEDVLNK